jgi:DNA-directed RNA polymerase specialized sigma24 family protein
MMAIRDWLEAWRGQTRQLIRIADALDRIAPLPAEAGPVPPDEVDYYDEQKAAKQEALDMLKQAGLAGPDAMLPEEEDV